MKKSYPIKKMDLNVQNFETQTSILFKLAADIIALHKIELPAITRHQAKRVLLDTLGVGIYGSRTSLFKKARQAIGNEYAAGNCLVWGMNESFCATGTAFFNALAASATDFDDGHRLAGGHPASVVVPAAMAIAKMSQATIEEMLSAIVIGYDIGARFSAARDISRVKTFSTGCWGSLASATCAALLLKLDEKQTMHALSLAALLSPIMMPGNVDVSSGSMAKEGVAWAARGGVQAAYLAKEGFVGPYNFLDEGKDYNHKFLVTDLGKNWYINNNYFKPYACCRWIHPAIDACLDVKRKNNISFDEIQNVEIDTFSRILKLARTREPINAPQAQFNLPFCVASALFHERLLPDDISGAALKNDQIRGLASKMILRVHDEFERVFPGQILCKITIKTSDHSFTSEIVEHPKWESDFPATDEELYEKFQLLVGGNSRLIWQSIMPEKVKDVRQLEGLIQNK